MENDSKYYYLKLKENFFDSDEIKVLENLDNGYLYSNILLKMYLKSLKNDGKLIFNDYIPYSLKMIATVTGHNVDVVEKAIKTFKELHLIEILDNGAIYMTDIQKFIGSLSSEGQRKQIYREKIKKELENGTKLGQCPDIISNSNYNCNSNYNLILNNKNIYNIYSAVVGYLNEKINANYKPTTTKTQACIKARLNEGFVLEDFYKVIDNKVKTWKGTKFEDFLRPETLFSNKFESYLNEKGNNYQDEKKQECSNPFLEMLKNGEY